MTLRRLIAKCDWDAALRRLQTKKDEASVPIPTRSKDIVYPLHYAVCLTEKPITREVLQVLIEQFPKALDINTFIGACENSRFLSESMELLFDLSSVETLHSVEYMSRVLVSKAIKKKNVGIVQHFIDRFPAVLEGGSILECACVKGTAEIVDKILAAGVIHKIDKAGGLYTKVNKNEDSLDVAIRLYDVNDDERRCILATCLQYANAYKLGLKEPLPDYPVLLAAVGLVPRRIFESFLRIYTHEITGTNQSGKYAILKTIQLMEENEKDNAVPSSFKETDTVNACRNGNVEELQRLLNNGAPKKSGHYARKYFNEFLHKGAKENALEVAINLFDENDHNRCEILKMLVQYANAAKMGKDVPPPNYPTILAAVGLVPNDVLLRLGKKYEREIGKMDYIGKLALKKVLKMKEEKVKYANRLDSKSQFPLHFNTRRPKFKTRLETIPQSIRESIIAVKNLGIKISEE